ncbi:helix-turn-helix domain-containing protein [Microbacterium rhizomatis]|uniref:helix-turn-helix domain-containing protein n=1 Tax=Microbacterium rhizomatis TaxID=1631477 RepID=UPI001B86C8EC|nr:helix-turn-helix domain-containing protein [Microbacterium rhizomatis]
MAASAVLADPSADRSADTPRDDQAGQRLGAHIRMLRRARRLTLVQVATETDLSHPFLSQIERGLAQPSLGSLRRIAVALGTSPIELIAAAEGPASTAPAVEVHRRGDGAVAADFASGSARMLAHGDRAFRPMEYEGENTEPGEHFVHAEDEFVYVLEGTVCVDLDGELRTLDATECAYFRGGVRHRWWSVRPGMYRLLIVKST